MIKHCLFIILFLLSIVNLHADEKELILGGDAGWNMLSVAKNISLTDSGRYGKQAIQITTDSESLTGQTDLLLNFEQNENYVDISGNYSILMSNISTTTQTIMGNYAGLGKGATEGIQLSGNSNSIFGKEGLTGSFTISFWLNPSLVENGETVFLWDSSRNVNNTPVYQLISAMFFQNRLEWNFTNIFSNYTHFKDITLKSTSLVIPDTWAQHSVSYNDQTGIVEYRINGKIEALSYATASGWSEIDVYSAILGIPNEITIGSNYTGRIDDFTITKDVVQDDFANYRYSPDGAYFESNPLGPFPTGSTIIGIQSTSEIPSQTDIQYFVRAGNNFYEWTDTYPAWIPVVPNRDISNVQGRYFQVAANLYTDGAGIKTPTLTEVRLQYNEAEPPRAPLRVFAESGNGYVDLSWLPSAGQSPDGYIIYYGESPGEYMGEGAFQGDSPIDVGHTDSFRITGLRNGQAYYFAIAAYSYTPIKTEGVLSQEVYARPLQTGGQR